MQDFAPIVRSALGAAMLAALVGLGGCADGIEMHSKLLDTLGVGSGPAEEPKLADRPGIIVPPPMASLPEPGSGKEVVADVKAQLPNDPTVVAANNAKVKRLSVAECNKRRNAGDLTLTAQQCPSLITALTGTGAPADGGDQ